VTTRGAGLTVRVHMTLQLEGVRFKHAGVKVTRIRELFSETETRYYQRLDTLLHRQAALEHYPNNVRRLQRLRAQRARLRRPAHV
jgi:hypothetical protein